MILKSSYSCPERLCFSPERLQAVTVMAVIKINTKIIYLFITIRSWLCNHYRIHFSQPIPALCSRTKHAGRLINWPKTCSTQRHTKLQNLPQNSNINTAKTHTTKHTWTHTLSFSHSRALSLSLTCWHSLHMYIKTLSHWQKLLQTHSTHFKQQTEIEIFCVCWRSACGM